MKILVIGQCTLHWGRMEFGNIGNYYVIEPFFRELHRVFHSATIRTTFQMSADFCKAESIECLPMDYYYGWKDDDLDKAQKELSIASVYNKTKELTDETPYIKEVLSSDLVIDYSGDIWGANADFVGPNRFLIGLIKDKIVQLLGKPIAMLAGSPGPFNTDSTLPFARDVFKNFTYVSIREPESRRVLNHFDFDANKVIDSACPAFLFEPSSQESIQRYLQRTPLERKNKPVIGFILCGWNLRKGPYSRTDWLDSEFEQYVNALSFFVKKYNTNVCLISHSNGFDLPPNFKPIKGRDFPLLKRFYDILQKTDIAKDVFLFDGIYTPKETKAIIANFDMLISGRVHGAVAGLSQNIPTVIIDYGHEPKAHKISGFAQIAGIGKYIANPADPEQIKNTIETCWINKERIHAFLKQRNSDYIKPLVHKQFDDIAKIMESNP